MSRAAGRELILWSYDASPFTQKVLRMLAIKHLEWRWVETPMLPPKEALAALTGGYRGTPVLQVGADVYIDSQLIAVELERRHPEPSLFPAGDRGLALALVKWSDAFFRSALGIIVHATARGWPEPFHRDRRELFADFDWEAALNSGAHARGQYRAHAQFLDAQLADGRRFLSGAQPGLVDAQAAPFVAMIRGMGELGVELLGGFRHLPAWEAAVAALGEGRRTTLSAEAALAVALGARAAHDSPPGAIEAADGLRAGASVEVSPDDTRRGHMRGELVRLDASGVSIRRRHPLCGEVQVHFPRLGYRIAAVS
jgi:glutathione S-transferase